MSLTRCFNIDDLRRMARRRLPGPIFHYLDGGADDEWTLRRNRSAFADYEFLPDVLTDVSNVRTSGRLFGQDIAWPLMLSPTGLTRMFHEGAELAVARAAEAEGLIYALSTAGTTTIEQIGRTITTPKLFQLYIFKDRGLTSELVRRAKDAGYAALALTADTPVTGNRERDRMSGLSLPPRLTWKSILGFALHPRWSLGALAGAKFDLVNMRHRVDLLAMGRKLSAYDGQLDQSLTWDDVEFLAKAWDGPLAVKGLMTPAQAVQARESGATAVMISNHGGRQLDGAPAPIDQIAAMRDKVGSSLEIICDGGVRRGSDIVKAIARGADACSIGKSYLYGLAAGGEAGVRRALTILREEFLRTMMLAGINDVARIEARHVRHLGPPSRH